MTAKGLFFVCVQLLLLLAFTAIPAGFAAGLWWQLAAFVLVIAGTLLAAAAMVQLGRGLTPMPVPRSGGKLITSGVYTFIRHPIYSGILLVVAGISLYSFNWPRFMVSALLYLLFHFKAVYEEKLLTEKYPGYREYVARTGRFFPLLRKK